MKIKIWVTVIGMFILFSGSPAQALTYSFTAGSGPEVIVTPLSGAETAVAYYNLFNGSGHPAFGAEQATAFFWLWEDTNTNKVSLSVIFNKANATAGAGKANFSLSGLPTGWSWTLMDDPIDATHADFGSNVDATPTWTWGNAFADGGVIGGLEGAVWEIVLDPSLLTGITNWYFVSGNGADKYAFSLNTDTNLTISASESGGGVNVVPEPSTLVLLGAGLLGLGILTRKSRA